MKWPSAPRLAALLLAADFGAFAFSASFTLFGRASLSALEVLALAGIAVLGVAAWTKRWRPAVVAALAAGTLVWSWILVSLVVDVGLDGLLDDLTELVGYVLTLAVLAALASGHAATARQHLRGPPQRA